MKRLISLGTMLLGFLSPNTNNPLHCQETPPLIALNEYIVSKLERDHIPGLAACIVKDDRVVWSKGFGFQNIAQKIPMTTKSIMGVASISKIVTAIAVMQLVERKQLDLNDPINKFLPFRIQHPDYPDAEITISQLLSHTSSISNGPSLWRSYSCGDQRENLEEWVRAYFLPGGQFYHKEGNFSRARPGERFSYSNADYPLLAYLIEVVSGMSFNQFCKRNIFDLLEMHCTSFHPSDVPAVYMATMYAYGYSMDLERDLMQPDIDYRKIVLGNYIFPLCNYTVPTVGAAGLYSSVEQISNLLIALMNDGIHKTKAILTKESVRKIIGPYVNPALLPGQFASYGLGGYSVKLNNGRPVWGHTGADPGMSTYMLFSPETRIGAVVLANRFVDIRDLIEWFFAEGFGQYCDDPGGRIDSSWSQYTRRGQQHKVVFRVTANYMPGGSRVHIIGDHRYLGSWVTSGIPLSPRKDRSWEKTLFFPDSARIEFKITRGSWDKESVSPDGRIPLKYSLVVKKDTLVNIIAEDWKDLVGD